MTTSQNANELKNGLNRQKICPIDILYQIIHDISLESNYGLINVTSDHRGLEIQSQFPKTRRGDLSPSPANKWILIDGAWYARPIIYRSQLEEYQWGWHKNMLDNISIHDSQLVKILRMWIIATGLLPDFWPVEEWKKDDIWKRVDPKRLHR